MFSSGIILDFAVNCKVKAVFFSFMHKGGIEPEHTAGSQETNSLWRQDHT